MNTDRSIRPLVAQFVPLKVETKGDQWARWASKYPPQGNGIPILYIIRADGQQMYGQSGPVPDGELSPFLLRHLSQAGRVLTDQESAALGEAVEAAQKAMEQGDAFAAVRSVNTVKKIGPLGNLGSFAKAAVEADQLVQELTEQGKTRIEQARQKLAGDDQFQGVLQLVEAKRVYASLPELTRDLTTAIRDLSKDATLRELLLPAEALDRAEACFALPAGKKRGIASLQQVAARYADTPAAKLARQRLEELSAEAADESSKTSAASSGAGGSSGEAPAPDAKRAASYLRMARAMEAKGSSRAAEYAQKAIETAPDSEEAREARKLLERLR
ncbi:MAG: hypothetical protein JXB62_06790 [Pirellulales bacterium]|nr:hypothetical protein [Pirellulales bacterium]